MAPKCPFCNRPVAITHRAVQCDGCSNWIHIKCADITPSQYKEYQSMDEFNWLCPNYKNTPSDDANVNLNNENVNAADDDIDLEIDEEKIKAFKEISIEVNKGNGLKIAHLNINGLLHKLNVLKVLLEETNFDILAVTETHLQANIPDDKVKIENYDLLRRDRKTDNGWGGVIVYHKELLNGIEYKTMNESDLEMIWLECNVKSQKFLVSCVYQPPQEHRTFLEKFENIIREVTSKRRNVIILGDLNIDMLEENQASAPIRNQFNNLLNTHYLYNAITKPTRITENSKTLIDHIIIPNTCKHKINNAHSVDPAISDHHLIFCSFSAILIKEKPIFKTIRNYKNIDKDRLKNDINSVPWQICDIFDDVDDTLYVWESLYNNVVDEHFKERKVKVRSKSHPWIDGRIRKQLNLRFKLLKAAQKTPKDSHEWKMYRRAKNHCTNVLRLAEAKYWREKFHGLSPSNRDFWNCINEYTGKSKKNTIGPLEDDKGVLTTDEATKCNILNDYFADIGKLDKIPENAELKSHIYRVTPTISSVNYDFYKLSRTFSNVFKPNKAGGHDCVSSKIIRLIGEDVLIGLHYVAKSSFQTNKFPTKHKVAKVTCIFKNKGSKTKSENYRPISLLCLPGKLLEAVFAAEIDSHVYHHKLLSNHQWGFRKGRSPELMLLRMCSEWSSLINSGKIIGVLLIDFSKAFDSVCHKTLMKKITAMGISGDMYEWCKSYLSNRRQFVTIGNSKSSIKSVDQGVPQGSILGPRCYTYHANDLPDVVKSNSEKDSDSDEAEMFADDTTEFSIDENIDNLIPKIQTAANSLHQWSTLNGMNIHAGKTKVMIVSKRKFIGPLPKIEMSGRNLEIVFNQKVLGVTIDSSLSWKDHVDKVEKNFRIKIKMLKRMAVLGKTVMAEFYFSTIIPSVTYNITVWGNNRVTLQHLDDLHAKAAKFIYRLPDGMTNEAILKHAGWMSIEYLYKRRLLCLTHKIFNKNIDSEISNMFVIPDKKSPQRRDNQLKISSRYKTDNQNTFAIRACKLWNAMPNELTEIKKFNIFRTNLRKFKDKISKFSFLYNSYNINDDFVFIS